MSLSSATKRVLHVFGNHRPWSWLPKRFLTGAIEGYRRYVSPLFGRHCRFHPTCSRYALDALTQYGAVRGGAMAIRRLLRCHPFHPGGLDPVPPPNGVGRNHAVD